MSRVAHKMSDHGIPSTVLVYCTQSLLSTSGHPAPNLALANDWTTVLHLECRTVLGKTTEGKIRLECWLSGCQLRIGHEVPVPTHTDSR
jgi:hypothetical protein